MSSSTTKAPQKPWSPHIKVDGLDRYRNPEHQRSGEAGDKVWSQNMRTLSKRSRAAAKKSGRTVQKPVKKPTSQTTSGENLPSFMRPTQNSVMRQRSHKGKESFGKKTLKWMESRKAKGKKVRKKVLRMTSLKSLRKGSSARSLQRINSIKQMKKMLSRRGRDRVGKARSLPNIHEGDEREARSLSPLHESPLGSHSAALDGVGKEGQVQINEPVGPGYGKELEGDDDDDDDDDVMIADGLDQGGIGSLKRSNVIRERNINFELPKTSDSVDDVESAAVDDPAKKDPVDFSNVNPPMEALDVQTSDVPMDTQEQGDRKENKNEVININSSTATGGTMLDSEKDLKDEPQIQNKLVGTGSALEHGESDKKGAAAEVRDAVPPVLASVRSDEVLDPVPVRSDSNSSHHQRVISGLHMSAIERATREVDMEPPISPQIDSTEPIISTDEAEGVVLKEKPTDVISTMSSGSLHRRTSAPQSSGESGGDSSRSLEKVSESIEKTEGTETVVVRAQRTRDVTLPLIQSSRNEALKKESPRERSIWWELGAGIIAGVLTAMWVALARGCDDCIEAPPEAADTEPLLEVSQPIVPDVPPQSTSNVDLQEEWLWHNA